METSLRARNRLRVRTEIQDAAWRLFAQHGYAAVTTDEIAAAAGVSNSTYFRHISSKDELLLAPVFASSARIVSGFAARPADEPAAQALATAIIERTAEDGDDDVRRWRDAMLAAPDISRRVSLIAEADRERLVAIAAQRLGAAPDDLEPAAVVHLLLSGAELAYRRWLTPHCSDELLTLVRATLDLALAGLSRR